MKIKDIMVIVAVALMTGGCSQQDDGLRQGDLVPIRLSASIDGSNTRTTDPTADTDDDTQDTQFLAGQAVDAYIKVKGGSWVTGLSSTTPRHFAAEGDGRLTRKSGEATDYYPMDATPVVIYAVHPSYTSAADFTVSTDQTNAADYAASDLCYSKTTEYNRQEAANTLSFNHVMSKLIVHVDVTGLGGTPTVSNLKVRAKTKTTMTYPTGSGDDYSLGTATTPAYISMNEDGAVIIPPQTTSAVGDVRISFSVSGFGPIAYEFPADFTFAPNTEYNYTVKVGASITVTSSIATWGSGVNADVTKNKAVQIGRPKLPIEYVADYNMTDASHMATADVPSQTAYFTWNVPATLNAFKNGTAVSGYHLPTKRELGSIFPPYRSYNSTNTSVDTDILDPEGPRIATGIGKKLNMGEIVAWGVTNNNGSYSFDVNQTFYNDYNSPDDADHIYTYYGLRFREKDGSIYKNGRYTCAYRYQYYSDATNTANNYLTVKVKYVGFNQSIDIDVISDEGWWSSWDFMKSFAVTGSGPTDGQYHAAGSYPNTTAQERIYFQSCTPISSGYWCTILGPSLFMVGEAATTSYSFPVRLFKDAD